MTPRKLAALPPHEDDEDLQSGDDSHTRYSVMTMPLTRRRVRSPSTAWKRFYTIQEMVGAAEHEATNRNFDQHSEPAMSSGRSRRGSSPPDPDLLRPPHFADLDAGMHEAEEEEEEEDEEEQEEDDYEEELDVRDEDEDDDDFVPAYAHNPLTPNKLRSALKGPNSKSKKRASLPSRLNNSVRTPHPFHNPLLDATRAPKSEPTVKFADHDVKPRWNTKLSAADEADIAAGSTSLRQSFIRVFKKVFEVRHVVANLAQDELGRLIVWLSSIVRPDDDVKVKYDWVEGYRGLLHGAPGGLLAFRELCEEEFKSVGWDREWEKHILHSVSVEKRMQLLCGIMSMYLETRVELPHERRHENGRVRSVPRTDWVVVCQRQGMDLTTAYCKIKSVITRLENVCKSERRGKAKTPLSKEYIISDEEEGEDEGVELIQRRLSRPRSTRAKAVTYAQDDDDDEEVEAMRTGRSVKLRFMTNLGRKTDQRSPFADDHSVDDDEAIDNGIRDRRDSIAGEKERAYTGDEV